MKRKGIVFLFLMLHSVIFSTAIDQTNIGIRATGLGGAFTAVADDSSAVFWNAAGLAFYPGRGEVNAGLYVPYIVTENKRQTTPLQDQTYQSKVVNEVPSFFAALKPTSDLGIGFGFYFPYGGGKIKFDQAYDYDSGALGNEYSLEKDLRAYTFTLSAAYRILENLSVGAGISLYQITLNIETRHKLLAAGPVYGDTSQFLSGTAVSGNAGILWKPTESLSLGFSARLPFTVTLKGDFEIKNATVSVANGTWDSYKKMKAPLNLGMGLAFQFSPVFRLSFDAEYQMWESAGEVEYKNKPTDTEKTHRYGWENAFRLGLGAEYLVSSDLNLMAGFKLAPGATEDRFYGLDNEDLTAYAVFFGAGYRFLENFKIEGGFSYVYYPDQSQESVDVDTTVKATGNFSKSIIGGGLQLKYLF